MSSMSLTSLIQGFSTPEATSAFQSQKEADPALSIANGHFRQTQTGLQLTSLGMGTYLGNLEPEDSEKTIEAILHSVRTGAINVIDTAINYRYQLSERAVGEALRQLATQGISRQSLFISSKNGFLTPDAALLKQGYNFQQAFKEHYIDTDLIQADDIVGGMHCMAPAYLNDQLDQSLENLGLETLDLMYLHNAAESQLPAIGRERFMSHLKKAFEFYETARAENRIRYYGLATWNCFRVDAEESPDFLNLETVVQLAESVGGQQHGFRFVQLPFNLAFTEALTLPCQQVGGESMPFLEAAMALNIDVFTSVPLLQGQLLQQSQLPRFSQLETPAQQCLQFVRSTPGVLAPLVGQKQMAHAQENIQVATVEPLALPEFEALLKG